MDERNNWGMGMDGRPGTKNNMALASLVMGIMGSCQPAVLFPVLCLEDWLSFLPAFPGWRRR